MRNASLIGHRDVAPKRSGRMLGIAQWANPFESKGTKKIIAHLLQKWRYLRATATKRTAIRSRPRQSVLP
jgi:hypothetical protein